MNLYIKNMVCNRCIQAVDKLLHELKIDHEGIQLGEVKLVKTLPENKQQKLKAELATLGFELLDDAKQRLIEKIKTLIIEHVHYNDSDERFNLSTLLTDKLRKDYSYLSHLFSEVEGITIEQFAIRQKIEKVKELITYDELSLSEIAFRLGYSSVAHLSAQFKKITGFTPSHFKTLGAAQRKTIDGVQRNKM